MRVHYGSYSTVKVEIHGFIPVFVFKLENQHVVSGFRDTEFN